MYDPIETDASYDYLLKLSQRVSGLRYAIMGGWGVYFQVGKEYRKAFGREYLKSRDIDVFVEASDELAFLAIIKELGFVESAYNFRYELVYDREEKKIISSKSAKSKPIYDLVYIFLDVFSNRKTSKLGSWVLPDLKEAKIVEIEKIPILDINLLLRLKAVSFFEREKLDKELKDACDIYALLLYSNTKVLPNVLLKKTIEKILNRPDLQEYIAEQVLGDVFKASLVVNNLKILS